MGRQGFDQKALENMRLIMERAPSYMKSVINEVAKGAKTDMLSDKIGIRSQLNVKRKMIEKSIKIRLPKAEGAPAKLVIDSQGIPAFDRTTSWKDRVQKPKLNFSGKRKARPRSKAKSGKPMKGKAFKYELTFRKGKPATTFNHAFMARMGGGYTGLFYRKGKGRFPLKEIVSSSPTDIFKNKKIHEAVLTSVSKRFTKAIDRQMARMRKE